MAGASSLTNVQCMLKFHSFALRREPTIVLRLGVLCLQGYSDMGRYTLQPLSYETLDYASGFASEQCPEGFCAVSRNTLRILTLERLGEAFNQQVLT